MAFGRNTEFAVMGRAAGGQPLGRFLHLIRRLFDPYRPERHYMRGPGPKWRARRGCS